MNADRLLGLYERVSEAQDAIVRLRRFVLDLATSGKLIEPNRAWDCVLIEDCLEPLSDGKFIHQGWSPRCETFPASSPGKWGVLKTTAIQDGFFLEDKNKELPRQLSPKEKLEISPGDILITCAGPRARCGIACSVPQIVPGRLMISGKMYRFRADRKLIRTDFLTLYLRSSRARSAIDAMKTGSSESGLNLTKDRFRDLVIHFGQLDEQRRIVAQVDDLMVMLDRLETARTTVERARDRLTIASLSPLSAPATDDGKFRAHTRFAVDALPALTARSDQVKHLRQTILNLAVRGKLVEQNPAEELALKLLKRVRAGANDNVRRKYGRSLDADLGKIPFVCPKGWMWTKVQNILDPRREISYGVIKLGAEPKTGGIPTLRCSDVRAGYIDVTGVRKVRADIESQYARTRLVGGEVVINIRGTLGGVALVSATLEGFNVAREVAVVPIAREISGPFVVYLMLSPYFWDHIQNNLRGIAYKGLNLGILRNLPIPLPPRAEQKRIVAKVDELMALCDRLEAGLTVVDSTRTSLLQAILGDTLASAADAY